MKYLGAQFSLWQIFMVRSLLALPMLAGIMYWLHRRGELGAVPPRHIGWVALRGFLFIAAGVIYFSSFITLSFASAAAMINTAPFFVVLFASIFGGERAPKSAWFATALGFAGVLLIVRPDRDAFTAYALLPLAAAVLYALMMVVTRIHCRSENTYTLALGVHLAFIITGAVASLAIVLLDLAVPRDDIGKFLLGRWSPLAAGDWLLYLGMGFALIIFAVGSAFAYQRARAATIAPFEYTYVISALIWGYWFFAEHPDATALTGMAMIVIGGLVVVKYQAKT